jgi:hypothetical protein
MIHISLQQFDQTFFEGVIDPFYFRQTVGGDVNILYSINIDLTLEQANFILTNENVSIKI